MKICLLQSISDLVQHFPQEASIYCEIVFTGGKGGGVTYRYHRLLPSNLNNDTVIYLTKKTSFSSLKYMYISIMRTLFTSVIYTDRHRCGFKKKAMLLINDMKEE